MRAGWIHFETRQRWHFWLLDRTLCGFVGNEKPLAMLPPHDEPEAICRNCYIALRKRGLVYT